MGKQPCQHVSGEAGEDGVRVLFQEQASPPGFLSSHLLLLGLSPWVLMDTMALPPLSTPCLGLSSLSSWLWKLQRGDLLNKLQGVKMGGLDIQISLQPVGKI